MAKLRRPRRLALLLATAVLTGCTSSEQVLPGDGPVTQFRRNEHWLSVYGGAGAKQSDLIDLNKLRPFEPGLSPDRAVRQFGQPTRRLPRERGAEYAEYHTPQGGFRVGSEQSADGYVAHPLYFFPSDRRPESILPDVVVRRLRATAPREVIMLFECGFAQPFIHLTLEMGQVQTLVWIHNRDLARRPSATKCTD